MPANYEVKSYKKCGKVRAPLYIDMNEKVGFIL